MRQQAAVIRALLICLSVFFLYLDRSFALESEWLPPPIPSHENPLRVTVPYSDQSQTRIIFDLAGVQLRSAPGRIGCEVEIPGEGHTSITGVPSLPMISRLVAIPAHAKVKLEYEFSDVIVTENAQILPTQRQPVYDLAPDLALEYAENIYLTDDFYPAEMVEIGRPAILRDLRVVRVTVNPVQYNPVNGTLKLYRHIEITLKYESGGEINTLNEEPQTISRSFANIYASKVINFPQLDLETDQEMGSILIIAPDNPAVLSIVQNLVAWKQKRGYNTVLADLSQTGGSSAEIKAFIQNAYDTWEPQLEYLILIGDCAGNISVPPSNEFGDHDYQRLEGDDILADISVGRYSCATTVQLTTEVNKVVNYESNPYLGETAWYKKGAVIADHSGAGLSSKLTKQGIRFKALMNGYTSVDTLWYGMGGSTITFTSSEINSGVGFYNFRGYVGMSGWSNTHTNDLYNNFKLPLVVTITCETGNITGPESEIVEEFFRVGTPSVPTGAIGAIGTATAATHTRHNNCVDNGIFAAFFDYDIFALGDALNTGKLDLYLSYPDNPTSVEDFSKWNNLIGDPSCPLWTDIPQKMIASYPREIPVGSTSIEITVVDSISGLPLDNVDVCLCGNGIQLSGLTDETGEISFDLPFLPQGEFAVTCTKHNYKPHLGNVHLVTEDIYVSWAEYEIDDDNLGASSGNDDGNINPGETIELGLSLKNYGDSLTATGISTLLQSSDNLIIFADSIQTYSDLAPDSTSAIVYGFVFSVSPDAVDQYSIPLNLEVTSNQASWNSDLPLSVCAPKITYQSCTVLDANNQLDPGEIADLEITVMNTGALAADNITGILSCEDEFITVTQNSSFLGDIGINQTAVSQSFTVDVSPDFIPGNEAHFKLYFSGGNGFTDTTEFTAIVGSALTYDPTGPDGYGYYALDNTDVYYQDCPIYEWIEIDPTVPGHQFSGQDLGLTDFGDEQDDTELAPLPFEFSYYGESFNRVSICSNGWLAFGDMTYFTNFRNWYIPSTMGAYSQVSPFWDDLYLTLSPPRKVYKYYDAPNHRFIVEWNVLNRAPANSPEIFELILLDPAHYPTESGDGVIIFQYMEVHNIFGWYNDNHFATVGIKSPNSLIGLEYSYWNHYSPGAATLGDSLAIKFSTDIPIHIGLPEIENLTISLGSDEVTLDWEDVPGVQNYYIYRSETPYFNIVGMIPIDSTGVSEYIDSSVTSEIKFYYRVTWDDGN